MLSVSTHNFFTFLYSTKQTKTHHSGSDESVALSQTFMCQMKLKFA